MRRVFPSPFLVIGVGRFGLALLERMGDDWAWLRQSEADPSVKNQRLLWVHASDETEEPWRARERTVASVVSEVGEGDLPSLALDFAILRSLGLIRHHDGTYQVAWPKDAGPPMEDPAASEGTKELRRRRFFDWLSLSPDPLIAVERLRRSLERHHELDLFVTPILNRGRQGHSPGILITVIARCHALAEGRDPSPWDWLGRDLGELGGGRIALERAWLEKNRCDELRGFAPEPLPGWQAFDVDPQEDRPPAPEGLSILLPAVFVPNEGDLATQLDPRRFLEVDWELSGWAAEPSGVLRIMPSPATPFRLGLFDHSPPESMPPEQIFEARLRELSRLVYQGLVRLWVDLQRDRGDELEPPPEGERRQDPMDTALRQSLELLGELLVRPLVAMTDGDLPAKEASNEEDRRWDELPARPSRFLSSLSMGFDPLSPTSTGGDLEGRLFELGGSVPHSPSARKEDLLFREVAFLSSEIKCENLWPDERRSASCLEMRRLLNGIVRSLYDFEFLSEYRNRPTRHPPRLTVFVVGDMGEPFTRAEMREVLREVHAELLRSFGPIFESYLEGFNRCLSIVPILWMPHPADPFSGAESGLRRIEESAIIDRVHTIRRWVESILPASRRRIDQIYVNGRVTDNAVIGLRAAVRQTRDFISFQTRNDLGSDDWLRRAATGSGTSDLFSSFSCYEIDFPGERCRDYLANLLARSCLARIRSGWTVSEESRPLPWIAPPAVGDLIGEAQGDLDRITREAGDSMSRRVMGRLAIERATTTSAMLAAFDERFRDLLRQEIGTRWADLIRRRGRIDDLLSELRQKIGADLADTLRSVREHSDRAVGECLERGGLPAAHAAFDQLRAETSAELGRQESQRVAAADLCLRHGIPSLESIELARQEVLAAARDKPDLPPLQFGLVLWGLLSFVVGAPIARALGGFLAASPLGVVPAWVLVRFPGVFGFVLLTAPACWLAERHLGRTLARVRDRISSFARHVRELYLDSELPLERESASSIRSFFMARLGLTGALAAREFSLRVHERSLLDQQLANRLTRSIEVQARRLAHLVEDLGARPAAESERDARPHDDLGRLFDTRSGEAVERLVDPAALADYFERSVGIDNDADATSVVADFLAGAGGLSAWRRSASLADTGKILSACRHRFDDLVDAPLCDHETFAAQAGARLLEFVSRRYPNIGFGAKFLGYEGLDPDGVQLAADAALILDRSLRIPFEDARKEEAEASVPAALSILEVNVRPDAAYLMSLVQGIRSHSVRNLKRFESFHDRLHMPDDRTFPLSQEEERGRPVNHLSGFDAIGTRLREQIRELESAATPAPGEPG